MKYIFVDTNNFIACALMTEPKHSPETIKTLKELLNLNTISLVLPEVVEIEFFRKVETELLKIEKSINHFCKIINNEFPNYLPSEKTKLVSSAKRVIKKRQKSSLIAKEIFKSLFEGKNIIKIPISNEIFINAFKRALAGKKPYKYYQYSKENEYRNVIDNDCLIFESILSKIRELGPIELVFCSGNIKDFAVYDDSQKEHILHPELEKSLPENTIVRYYLNLVDALNSEFQTKIRKLESERIKDYLDYTFLPPETLQGMVATADAIKHHINPEALKGLIAIMEPIRHSLQPEVLKGMMGTLDAMKQVWRPDELKGILEQITAVRHSGFPEGIKEAVAQADSLKRFVEAERSKGLFGITSDLEKSELSKEKDKKNSKNKKKKTSKE